MKQEMLKRFVDKEVKLVKKDDFILYGRIIAIDEDAILFQTKEETAAISLDFIGQVTPRREL